MKPPPGEIWTPWLALGLAQPENASVDRSPDARRWGYVLDTGVQLGNWNLGPLAAYLWRRALEAATAFDRRDGEVQGTLAELRNRLVVLEASTAPDPETARERVGAYLAGHPRADLVRSAATQLLTASQFPAACRLYESLTRQEPGNEEDWRNLLAAYNAEGDLDAMETALVSLLGTAHAAPSPLARGELVRDLATLRQFEGDAAGALRLLEREFQDGNHAVPVVTSLATAYERAGRLDDAARVWQDDIAGDYPNARTGRLALARLAERRGNLPQAISWLEEELAGKGPPGTEAAVGELAGLYLRTGREDQAKLLTLGLLKTNRLEALPAAAQAFAQAGRQSAAPGVAAGGRAAFTRSANALPTPATVAPERPRPTHGTGDGVRTRDAAAGEVFPGLARAEIRLRNGAVRAGPSARSRPLGSKANCNASGGEGRGEFSAGEQLVGFYLDTHQTEPLRHVVQAIDARPNLPEQSLAGIEKRLVAADLAGVALPLSERLFRRFPQNEVYGLVRAEVLWKTGQTAEAGRLLEALDGNACFREDLSVRIGALYEKLGEAERARSFYVRAVQRDPAGARPWRSACGWRRSRPNARTCRRRDGVADRLPVSGDGQRSHSPGRFPASVGDLGGGSRGLPAGSSR